MYICRQILANRFWHKTLYEHLYVCIGSQSLPNKHSHTITYTKLTEELTSLLKISSYTQGIIFSTKLKIFYGHSCCLIFKMHENYHIYFVRFYNCSVLLTSYDVLFFSTFSVFHFYFSACFNHVPNCLLKHFYDECSEVLAQ